MKSVESIHSATGATSTQQGVTSAEPRPWWMLEAESFVYGSLYDDVHKLASGKCEFYFNAKPYGECVKEALAEIREASGLSLDYLGKRRCG